MRVLITGATGFVGRLLVQRLNAFGVETFGLALPEDIAHYEGAANSPQGLTLLPADLRKPEELTLSLARVRPDRIVHLAAAGVTDPAIDSHLALEHNVHGTINLLQAAFQNSDLACPPRQMIVIRTPGESQPANAYTASKAAAWSFCQMYSRREGWPIVGAMIFQAYGPGQPIHTFIQAALRCALAGEDFAMTSGTQSRDWIYIADVIEGLAAITAVDLQPGASIDLGNGVSTPLIEVAELAYQIVGRGGTPRPGAIPDRAGEQISHLADVGRSAKLLGWTPQVSLAEGLRLVMQSLTT